MMLTINVKDDVGTANGYPEVKIARINRRKALRGGAIVLLDDTISFEQGSSRKRI